MTEKELHKLKRGELLEMMLAQSREIDALRARVSELEEKLADREIRIRESGSSAEAALKINGIFEAAQAAADQYPDAESLKGLRFAVESGSAGMAMAKEYGFDYVEVIDQATALLEVKSGTADAAIIDALMAGAMVGEGTDYADLTYTISLNAEEYGVGFRKGSDLAAALNDFFQSAYADGSLQACAERYGIQAALIAQ